jgi:hypothetical protein
MRGQAAGRKGARETVAKRADRQNEQEAKEQKESGPFGPEED